MAAQPRSLSYEASKCVLQYLQVYQRLHIRHRCPTLRVPESLFPLVINRIQIEKHSLRIDDMEFKFTCQKPILVGVVRSHAIDAITIINHKTNVTNVVDLGRRYAFRAIRASCLLEKLLGGTRHPVIINSFELKRNGDQNEMEENLNLPKHLKMKVRNLEIFQLDEHVIQQLSNHLIGAPLRTFRVTYNLDFGDPGFNHPLIQNAQKIDLPIKSVHMWAFNYTPTFPQKAIILNNGCDNYVINDSQLIVTTIRTRVLSNLNTGTNITIHIDKECLNNFMDYYQEFRSKRGVVDDVENNQFDIPCISIPMGQIISSDGPDELNVYELSGAVTNAILKIVVMPRGSARLQLQQRLF